MNQRLGSFDAVIQPTHDSIDVHVNDDAGRFARVSLFEVPGRGLQVLVWDSEECVSNVTLRRGPAAAVVGE